MSNDLPASGTRARWRRFVREPLLHFLVLGAALFAIDHVVAGRDDDPYTITVDAGVDQGARDAFRQENGREPDAEELHTLRRAWLDDEVLYREGIAMQIDKGDPLIRNRVIFKMLNLIEAGLRTPTFDEKTLREWFERNRARYEQPGVAANFDELASVVLQDWIDATLAEQRSAAVLAMEKRYTVEVRGGSRAPAAP